MSELSELGKAAVWYCEHGYGIIPLHPRSKAPAMKLGLNDWFSDPKDAIDLWTKFPDLNIAIVCGTPSHGLLVLDIDVDEEKDKDGYATLSAWEKAHGELPATAVAITGKGGMHYIYRTDRTNIHPSVNEELGVDIRCDGAYIVAPPSIHPNGNRYEWQDHPDDVPIAVATGAVYDFIDHVQRNGGQDETKKENGKFKLPDRIKEGERDKTLFRYASHLRAIGRSDEEILNAVAGANFTRCDPPMDSKDIERIVRSACKYERGEHTNDDAPNVGKPGTSDSTYDDDGDVPLFRSQNGKILTNVLARVIIERNHARLIDGAPAVWTGKRWEFGKRAISRVALEYADDITKAKKDEVYSYISDKAEHVTADKSFDDGYYVQFADCTYDALNQVIVEPDWHMLITGTLPIVLNLDAEYGLADEFIASLANGDEATMTAMQEVVGACMCCRRVIAQSPMLIGRAHVRGGEASNGKSTYIKTIQNLLGSGNYSSLDIATLGQRFQAARIIGKLANLGDDIPNGFLRGDELSIFKKLVTGEQIYSDIKNSEGIEFRPNATMIFSMNSMPRLADTTDGVFRRLAFIPFRNRFDPGMPGFDPDIEHKMATDANLQRLAVLGLMTLPDLIERGKLTEIPDMAQEIESIRVSNDVVRRWMQAECIETDDVVGRWVSDVYSSFFDWAKKAGENTVKQDEFKRRLLAVMADVETYETRDRVHEKRGHRFRLKEILDI